MIWYKAWLESRWRFLICFGLVAVLVAADCLPGGHQHASVGDAA